MDILKSFGIDPEDIAVLCGEIISLSKLEKMGLLEFNNLVHLKSPISRIVRYFPNTISNDGLNHSLDALSNNTVYLNNAENFDDCFDCAVDLEWTPFYERRIKKYCLYFNVDYNNVSLEELPYKIALKLYEFGTAQNAIDSIDNSLDEVQKLEIKNFILRAYIAGQEASGWVATIVDYVKDEYMRLINTFKHFKITCLTTSPYLNRMWANHNNKGFCIEYELDTKNELFFDLFPVIYSQKRNDYTPLSEHCDQKPNINDLWQIYFNGLLRKSLHWIDQQEWRLIRYETDNKAKSIPFFKIKKVYLGNKMPIAERQKIIAICKKETYPYVGMIRKPNSFDLIECEGDCSMCQQCLISSTNKIK